MWGTTSKALQKPNWITSVALPLSSDAVTPFLYKAQEKQTPNSSSFPTWIFRYVGGFILSLRNFFSSYPRIPMGQTEAQVLWFTKHATPLRDTEPNDVAWGHSEEILDVNMEDLAHACF